MEIGREGDRERGRQGEREIGRQGKNETRRREERERGNYASRILKKQNSRMVLITGGDAKVIFYVLEIIEDQIENPRGGPAQKLVHLRIGFIEFGMPLALAVQLQASEDEHSRIVGPEQIAIQLAPSRIRFAVIVGSLSITSNKELPAHH